MSKCQWGHCSAKPPGCFGCDQVILRAVGQAGSCLSYASEELRADPAIALAALSSDVEAFEFVAPRLWEDFPLLRPMFLAYVGELQDDGHLMLGVHFAS